MSNWEREANRAIEEGINALICGIRKFFQALWRGIRSLRSPGKSVGFLLCVGTGIGVFYLRPWLFARLESANMPIYLQYALWYALMGCAVWYLLIIGSIQKSNKFEKEFASIGFKSKDGAYPYFVRTIKEKRNKSLVQKSKKRKISYLFTSAIPMTEWVAAKDRLQVALDCNILRFSEGKSKRLVRLVTVPASCRIPDMVTWNRAYQSDQEGIIVVGEGAIENVQINLNKTPHVLIAGETGSGKSVILRNILAQMVNKGARIFMLDFKGGVEFGKRYEQYGEVVMNLERADAVLAMLIQENEKRLTLFRETEAKNLPEYNEKTGENLSRIGLFCDEIAEMLDKTGLAREKKEGIEAIEGKLSTLARLSRATGINLFLGVQRPDAKVLTGQIKNNIPVRICGRFADRAASEIVLGNSDAVYLPEIKGRFLFRLGNETTEFQAYWFDDDLHLASGAQIAGHLLIDGAADTKEESQAAVPQNRPRPRSKPPRRKTETRAPTQKELPLRFDYESASQEEPAFDFMEDDGVIDWGVEKEKL